MDCLVTIWDLSLIPEAILFLFLQEENFLTAVFYPATKSLLVSGKLDAAFKEDPIKFYPKYFLCKHGVVVFAVSIYHIRNTI